MGENKEKKKRIKSLLAIVLSFQFLSSMYSTQKLASIFEYHPSLGWDFGKIGLPKFYFPFAWLDWYYKCKDISNISWAFTLYGTDIAYYSFLASFIFGMLFFLKTQDKAYDEHGTAHFATEDDLFKLGHTKDGRKLSEKLKEAFKEFFYSKESILASLKTLYKRLFSSSWILNDNDLFSGKGVYLGKLDDGRYIQDNAKTHVLLLAPTRSGKGVGHIVPTLLTWEGSLIVADPKGENWELTAGFRKYILKNKVMQFKPMHEDSCKYNPFTEIRITTAKEMGDLQLITKILVDPTGKGFETGDTHWIESADVLLQGVTLHLLYQKRFHNVDIDGKALPPAIATLSDVLDFLYDGQDGSSKKKEDVKKDKAGEAKPFSPKEEIKKTTSGKSYTVLDIESQIESRFNDLSIDIDDLDNGEDSLCSKEEEERYLKALKDNDIEVIRNFGNAAIKNIKEKAKNNFEKMNAEAKPSQDFDPNEAISEFADEEKAGVEGLQKKLQYYLLAAQYLPYENKVTGYKHAPDDDEKLFERLYPDKKSRRGMHPFVRQIFQSMVDKPDKEFGSILSTLDTALSIYRNPILVHNISSSDFVMKDVMDCKEPISLYLVFGPGEIQVIKPLLRVIIEMMWRLNVEELLKHRHRLLMLLDEFPAFGKLEGIEQSAGFTAGYGIKMFIIAQDMNQINKLYDTNNYLVSNCQVQIYHGPSDNNSAKYISEKLGKKTIKTTSESRNSNIFPMPNSFNDSLIARDLMTPDEVFRMDPDKLLVFCKGCAPIMANKIKYYANPDFSDKAKIKPPGHSDTVSIKDREWKWKEYKLLDIPSFKEWGNLRKADDKKLQKISLFMQLLNLRKEALEYEIDFDCLLLSEELGENAKHT